MKRQKKRLAHKRNPAQQLTPITGIYIGGTVGNRAVFLLNLDLLSKCQADDESCIENSLLGYIYFGYEEENVAPGNIYTGQKSVARHGWGPLLYEIAIQVAVKDGMQGLIPDRKQLSNESKVIWNKFFQRTDVKHIPISNKTVHWNQNYLDQIYSLLKPKFITTNLSKTKLILKQVFERLDEAESILWEYGESWFRSEFKGGEYSPMPLRKKLRRRNPEMALSNRLFQAPLKEYSNYSEKWWREVIQNSVDAGATEITCTITETPEGILASIEDNGGGMSQDVLLNKFLVFGETTKEGASGSTGGFGKAKELILLPWTRWEITTQNTTIRGVANKYDIVQNPESLKGTKLTVLMPTDKVTNFDLAAKSFIRKCYLPHVKFSVNGDTIEANLAPGNLVDDKNPRLKIHWNQDQQVNDTSKILVRINGIFMYDDYLSSKIEGTIIIELVGTSVELLTTNREGLSKQEDRMYYRKFLGTLEKDVRSGLKGAGNRVRKIYKGAGKFDVNATEEMADDLSQLVNQIGKKKYQDNFDLSELENLIEAIKEISKDKISLPDKVYINPDNTVLNPNGELLGFCKGNEIYNSDGYLIAELSGEKTTGLNKINSLTGQPTQSGPGKVIGGSVTGELAEALLNNIDVTNSLEDSIKQLAWQPDFFLVNEIKDFKVPADFAPETMSVVTKRLARFWAELCRFTLLQLGSSRKYGVGFIFSHNSDKSWIAAEYDREAGEDWLLINPYLEGNPDNDIYNINDDRHLDRLYSLAIHECTHVADGIVYHDEDFSSALTRNIAKTLRGRKNLRAIRDAIKALYPKGPSTGKKTLGEVRTFYKVVKPGKGRPALFEKLSEARKYIDDNYKDTTCKIIGLYLPEGITDRKVAVDIGEIEFRTDGASYSDEIQLGLGIEASIQDSLDRADELLVSILKNEADTGLWQRNPSDHPDISQYQKEAETGFAQFSINNKKVNLLWQPDGDSINIRMQTGNDDRARRFKIKNEPKSLYRPWTNQHVNEALSELEYSKNPIPHQLLELEWIAFTTKNPTDTANYWLAALNEGIIPKPFRAGPNYKIWSLTGNDSNYVGITAPTTTEPGVIFSRIKGRPNNRDTYTDLNQQRLLLSAHLNLLLDSFERNYQRKLQEKCIKQGNLVKNPTVNNNQIAEYWLGALGRGVMPEPTLTAKNVKGWILNNWTVSLITNINPFFEIKYQITLKKDRVIERIYAATIKEAERKVKDYLELLLNDYFDKS